MSLMPLTPPCRPPGTAESDPTRSPACEVAAAPVRTQDSRDHSLDPVGQGRARALRVRDGTAYVPRRLPSYAESENPGECPKAHTAFPDRHASPGRSAARRYRAPVHLAYSATLSSKSTSAPALLGWAPSGGGSLLRSPTRDASGRLLQSTFQRRAPGLRLASNADRARGIARFTSRGPLCSADLPSRSSS
jgi:hypothetical protein